MAKRALLVGLNAYPNPANDLRGCLNDVRQVRSTLADHFGFRQSGQVHVLTDSQATTGAIREGLGWLVGGARAGDVLVFHYSGHGSQVPDDHGDESTDGLDEIICPYDLDWDDPFTDDDLHAIVKDVPRGVNLTVVLDCCHAGTGLREWPAGGRPERVRYSTGTEIRCLRAPGPNGSGRRPAKSATTRQPGRVEARLTRFGRSAAEEGAVLIAACRDDQVSADAFIDGDYHGALTYYLCRALAGAGFITSYDALARDVRRLLRLNGFEQVPQLEGPPGAREGLAFEPLVAAPKEGQALAF